MYPIFRVAGGPQSVVDGLCNHSLCMGHKAEKSKKIYNLHAF